MSIRESRGRAAFGKGLSHVVIWLRGVPVGLWRKKVRGRENKTTAVETGGASLVCPRVRKEASVEHQARGKVTEEVWRVLNVRSRRALLAIEAARG